MQYQRSFNQVMRWFLAGVAGILAGVAYDLFMFGSAESSLEEIGVYAFLAGAVLGLSELMSLFPKTPVRKGIVFGLTIGIVGGLLLAWFKEESVLKHVIGSSLGGVIAGLWFKLVNHQKPSKTLISGRF